MAEELIKNESLDQDQFEKIVGKKAIINEMDEQIGDVPYTYADIEKARNDLNYNPKVKIEDGLKKMYESFFE